MDGIFVKPSRRRVILVKLTLVYTALTILRYSSLCHGRTSGRVLRVAESVMPIHPAYSETLLVSWWR